MSHRLRASQLNWISGTPPEPGTRLTAKVRYRQADQACRIESVTDQSLEVRFDQHQRAVTPGQSVVLYDGDECLGGGIIDWTNSIPGSAVQGHSKVAS
jgi:tRNA-specific 2-thiouridylase